MIPTQWAKLGSKQAIALLYIAFEYMEKETTTIYDTVSEEDCKEDCNNWDDYVILWRSSTRLIRAARAPAAVARAGKALALERIIKYRSVAIMDCGATDTLTSSLINATNVERKPSIIETADRVERMRSNYKCIKTY
jgi:hypothetical protein